MRRNHAGDGDQERWVRFQYLIAYLDKNGDVLDGSKTYKLHRPPKVTANEFWSFTLYDNQTRFILQTDQRCPGLDDLGDGLKPNAAG